MQRDRGGRLSNSDLDYGPSESIKGLRSWNGIKEHLDPCPRLAKDAVTSQGQSVLAAGEGVQLRTDYILSTLPPTSL